MDAPTSLTAGVDLASQAQKTALCVLRWWPDRAEVVALRRGVPDAEILAAHNECASLAIDAPFGWPTLFAEFLRDHHRGQTPALEWVEDTQRALRLRQTDVHVWQTDFPRPPLSVSADSIAMPAMRCAGLLRSMGIQERDGSQGVFEVYPALALHRWIGASSGYKGKKGAAKRHEMVEKFQRKVPWLELPQACRDDDDQFDALVAAVIAKACTSGLVDPIPAELREAARREGWIACPAHDALTRMVRSTRDQTKSG